MSIRDERIARCIGWLEGFSTTIWALVSMQERELVAAEAVAEYDEVVKELRDALSESLTVTGPYVVKTMPCTNPKGIEIGPPFVPTCMPVDTTPTVTYKAGDME